MDLTMGQKLKIMKLTFRPEKSTYMGSKHTKRSGMSTFGGYVYEIVGFGQYFGKYSRFEISMLQ